MGENATFPDELNKTRTLRTPICQRKLILVTWHFVSTQDVTERVTSELSDHKTGATSEFHAFFLFKIPSSFDAKKLENGHLNCQQPILNMSRASTPSLGGYPEDGAGVTHNHHPTVILHRILT